YGPNEITKEKKRPLILAFIDQFKSFLIIILLIAVGISLLLGEILDAITILAIVIASAILGFFEEYRSEKALEMLKKLAAPVATVIRNEKEYVVKANEIVPGDIIVLKVGDKVPADARLLEAINLKVDEASLTGESTPVEKKIDILPKETSLSDRINMVFSGTTIIYGRGKAIVTATGMNSEFGKIASIVQEVKEEKTPLERRMEHVGKWLGILCLVVCGIVASLGLLRGYEIIEMLIWGVSLAVAAVPEALPAVVTGALAIGMYAMAKKNAIVRKLPAVETLGCTTIICSDKTGTMTKGEMTVRKIYINDKFIDVTGVGYEPKGEFLYNNEKIKLENEEDLKLLLKVGALCNDASLDKENDRWVIRGDTTEGAIKVAAYKANILEEELKNYPRIGEIPFTSERKRMTTIHYTPDKKIIACMKGAPEIVLEKCKWILKNGEKIELTNNEKNELIKINESMAGDGLRNLAIAYKFLDEKPISYDENSEKDFIFIGIVGMIDPPREEVKEAIKLCKSAGIKVVMITGDHKLTALAVAKELGMIEGSGKVLTGVELDNISSEEFEKIVEEVSIYARVSPEHKVRIVEALKKKGHVVAMTGDGINDAPALKRSDIGVAMGITGTEVTKEASDMVLADDNFATIVEAVKEGRRIYDNIKKYLTYLLQCNIAEILTMLFATLLNLPLPLTAIQLLWVNLTTDGLPALALGVDPADPEVMKRKPRSPKESIFSKEVKAYLIGVPIIITILLLSVFSYSFSEENLVDARTTLFTSMILIELTIALTCRSLTHPIKDVGFTKNKFLIIAIIVSFLMQLIVLYVPFLHPMFDVTFPTTLDWIMAIFAALIIFIIIEVAKALNTYIKK
ncbi:MAG: cation-translocating P-type ATPase, partial [Nitrososphaerota archaeon]